MTELIYYNPRAVVNEMNWNLLGIAKFSYLFKVFNPRMMLHDRTGTLTMPVHIKSLFPIPAFRKIEKTYEEICNERAAEILQRAEMLGVLVYVFWSGGIDSTLVIVSLLKNATDTQKANIVVLLSGESITENPRFYQEHIRGKLRTKPSTTFHSIVGTEHLITSGELNDQLFGASISLLQPLMKIFGDQIIYQPYRRDILFQFYNLKFENAEMTNFYLDLIDRLIRAAPIPIITYSDYAWWLLFALDWQSVFLRVLQFTPEKNARNITMEYVRTNLNPFFGTEEFQLWSMNNPDKRIKNTWSSFKWPCKDIIYDFTKDADYRDTKLKMASIHIWQYRNESYKFIDESMRLFREMDPIEYYNPNNSFW
ncbi:MAG: hypothetical protein A3C70_02285 [Candidatus Zambryskibacteria bacterium RIFCSPHIGHO2_02_FULL_43_14]|uniref:Asparagine synthetase domain-containing protein n=1 Tax=Candidatus Zambryskibacteria bacterium RIFCSPHIGHO2_02_FULL_43_14 TaxID=1802748 RepID=A0A1G2TGD6_9BACT|nr:MAG: hypothetical protein A3C70_02285 [Candidatus Zambryskibacteria bacterium RIFCSPHIGHO2_02_FULL_43_14]